MSGRSLLRASLALLLVGAVVSLALVFGRAKFAGLIRPEAPTGNQRSASTTPPSEVDDPSGQVPTAKRYAVLIGINVYKDIKLPPRTYAEDDVTDLAAVLLEAGYEVTLLADIVDNYWHKPTKANIEVHLKRVLGRCRPDDAVLIAFALHGCRFANPKGSDPKDAYFCPLDGLPFGHARGSLVPLSWVSQELGKSAAGTKVLLVDACRDDPDAGRYGRGAIAPDDIQLPQGVAALFSCRAGEQTLESDQLKHGIFFYHVLEGLKGKARDGQGRVTFAGLADYVTREVTRGEKGAGKLLVGVRQTPNRTGDSTADPVLLTVEQVDETRPADLGLAMGGRLEPLDCTGEAGVSAAAVRQAQAAWAQYFGRQVEEEDEIAPGVKMAFVLVPPGRFRMGSPKEEKDYIRKTYGKPSERDIVEQADQEVPHEVELTQPFYLGKYPVTQAQYQAVTGKNPSAFKGAELPVECVSWEQADAFAKELSGKRELKQRYRLPTEAEWEYACRGGRPFSHPFGIGDGRSLSSLQANFWGDYPYGRAPKGPLLKKTTPVASTRRTPWGCMTCTATSRSGVRTGTGPIQMKR